MRDEQAVTITVEFEVVGWDEQDVDAPAEGPRRARAVVRKQFRGGLDASSVADVLTTLGDGGSGYLAAERVTGTLAGRRGTFVLQHGGLAGATGQQAFGHVVPGSGTGELAGLGGEAVFAHDEQGARMVLTYTLPAQ